MTNPVLNVIRARYSCRSYSAEPLTREEIDTLIESALCAPTGTNSQKIHVTAVVNKALLEEIDAAVIERFREDGNTVMLERLASRGNSVLFHAPCVFFLSSGGSMTPGFDTGIAAENIALAAKSMGLDSVIIAMISKTVKAKFEKRLELPEGYTFELAVAVGHAASGGGKQHAINPGRFNIIN